MSAIAITAAGIAAIILGIPWWIARRERAEVARFMAALWPQPAAAAREATPLNPASLKDLPAPAARYLRYTIEEGAPQARAVRFTMRGHIRFARGRPSVSFHGEEVLHAGKGFLWKARTGGALTIRGFDRYYQGIGEMSWRLFGLIPLVRTHDANVSRSARERFVMERLLVPASLLPGEEAEWQEIDGETVLLRIRQDNLWHELQLKVTENGAPRKLTMQRWGNFETEGNTWRRIPYSAYFEDEFRQGGYTLPRRIRVSWWAGTERELEVVNFEVTAVEFRAA